MYVYTSLMNQTAPFCNTECIFCLLVIQCCRREWSGSQDCNFIIHTCSYAEIDLFLSHLLLASSLPHLSLSLSLSLTHTPASVSPVDLISAPMVVTKGDSVVVGERYIGSNFSISVHRE